MSISATEKSILSNIEDAAQVILEIVGAYDCSDKYESISSLQELVRKIDRARYELDTELNRKRFNR